MNRIIPLIVLLFLFSCGSEKQSSEAVSEYGFDEILGYIQANGDLINAKEVPKIMDYSAFAAETDKNNLLIDTRKPEDFDNGHVPGAVNVTQKHLLDYFERNIEPTSFNRIAILCYSGQAAGYQAALLTFAGYQNVYFIRWGMSAIDSASASQRWLKSRSSKYESMLTKEPTPKKEAGTFPVFTLKAKNANNAVRQRVRELLDKEYSKFSLKPDTVFNHPETFYIVNYWPEKLYNLGHIPGARQYTPKQSLKRETDLATLPTDKPILVYCFSGQHAANVVAYLRLIGYEAYSIGYGGNSFMHSMMSANKEIGHAFSEKYINVVPLSTKNKTISNPQEVTVKKVSAGGC
jgi:rhodanese-related sulfurtransferase